MHRKLQTDVNIKFLNIYLVCVTSLKAALLTTVKHDGKEKFTTPTSKYLSLFFSSIFSVQNQNKCYLYYVFVDLNDFQRNLQGT